MDKYLLLVQHNIINASKPLTLFLNYDLYLNIHGQFSDNWNFSATQFFLKLYSVRMLSGIKFQIFLYF